MSVQGVASLEASAIAQPQKVAVDDPLLREFRSAAAQDLEMLAVLHDVEPSLELIQNLKSNQFPEGLGLKFQSEFGLEAMDLLANAIVELPDPVDAKTLDDLAVDYTNIYLTYSFRAAPTESVWIDYENLEKQEPMFKVRECYERHGLMAPDWRKRADDHLVMELQFLAHLLDPDKSGDLKEAATFMDEHLLRWLLDFSKRVASRCDTPFFAGLSMLTGAYCEELRGLLAKILEEARPTKRKIDMRMRPEAKVQEVPLKFMPGIGPGW